MIDQLVKYYQSKDDSVQSCLLALRSIILKQDEHVSETMKWHMPCFTYKKKMFCFLWTDKKTDEPYILFVEGKHLNHPKLEIGDRTRMKIYRVDSNADILHDEIKLILVDALNLYRDGVIPLPL